MALTEEQKKRMEENRRKALEKRQLNKSGQVLPSSAGQAQPSLEKSTSSFYGKTSVSRPELKLNAGPSKLSTSSHGSKISASPDVLSPQQITGRCVLMSRERFIIDIKYHAQVIAIFKSSKSGQYNAQTRNWHFKLLEHDDLIAKLKSIKVFVEPLHKWILGTFNSHQFKGKLIPDEAIDWGKIEPTLDETLMPFQRDGVMYALKRHGRILLADDMGLGKTLQALAIASYYKEEWPMVIVCPSSVRFAWKSALIRWIPSIPEEDVVVVTSGRDELEGEQVIIISYDLLSKKQDELIKIAPKVAILDECHLIKSAKSARTKAAEAIFQNSSRILLLSGTPALSRPIELYSQISLIDPKLFPYVTDFGMRYCEGKKVTFGPNKSHYDFQGSSNMEELKILMSERFMVRRLKSEVLSQLPAKLRQMVILDPSLVKSKSREMQSSARLMKNKSLSKSEQRGILLEWFHSTANAKSAAVQDYIKDLIEGDRKFLCFAHHNTMMNDIAATLDKLKTRYIRIDGSTSSSLRKHLCDAFQTEDSVRVALLSITAANSGLTLTAAQLVVFAELFWNPGILTQAEDRAHRIGQTDNVTIQYLVATSTADDELWPLIQRKLDVLNKAGLSKDNFMESESHKLASAASDNTKITDFFSTSMTEEDMAALDEEWDGTCDVDDNVENLAKRQRHCDE